MVDLVLRPSGLEEKHNKPWSLQLRYHESVGPTDYLTLCRVSDDIAKDIIRAGKADWLFGEPDWDDRQYRRDKERARVLREEADTIEGNANG